MVILVEIMHRKIMETFFFWVKFDFIGINLVVIVLFYVSKNMGVKFKRVGGGIGIAKFGLQVPPRT